ncbi:hypothetical protein HU200_050901 [Digitaria exilis]|uniref:Reverse transcriptase zinc-binding domain-containing protein n=1 Tax=Digitaria exilis TaxID=1010633 RepID=A0A835AQX6_9POAL|nr:hypothetical protein HU200_050901 [Digitaria exilis]
MRIWNTHLPTKVKYFGWLLYHGRFNTRASLHHKGIRAVEDSCCVICTSVLETQEHIFTECPTASAVWVLVGATYHQDLCRTPWLIGDNLPLPSQVQLDVVLLIMWQIWKARNAMIFDRQPSTPSSIVQRVI